MLNRRYTILPSLDRAMHKSLLLPTYSVPRQVRKTPPNRDANQDRKTIRCSPRSRPNAVMHLSRGPSRSICQDVFLWSRPSVPFGSWSKSVVLAPRRMPQNRAGMERRASPELGRPGRVGALLLVLMRLTYSLAHPHHSLAANIV